MAIKAYRQVSASEEVRELLEFRLKAEHDEATRLSHARKEGREEGRQEGREEGREEGRQEGRQEGEEEGRKRGKIEAARQMIAAGMDPQTVCLALGVTSDQLQDA